MSPLISLLLLSLMVTSCFKALTPGLATSTQLRDGGTEAVTKETTLTKASATVDSNATTDQKMTMGEKSKLSGTSISIAPGTLNISTDIIIEQGADLADTTLSQEVGLTSEVSITQAGNGVVIRPSVATVLQKPIQLNLPLPVSGLGLAAVNYAVYYKYLDPLKNQLFSGMQVADGVSVKLVFDESSKRDTL